MPVKILGSFAVISQLRLVCLCCRLGFGRCILFEPPPVIRPEITNIWLSISTTAFHLKSDISTYLQIYQELFSIFAGCIGIFAILNVLTRNLVVGLSRLPLPHPEDGERTEELQHLNAKVQIDGELPQEGNTEKEKKEERESQREDIVA